MQRNRSRCGFGRRNEGCGRQTGAPVGELSWQLIVLLGRGAANRLLRAEDAPRRAFGLAPDGTELGWLPLVI